jgi:DNA-binding transcriptional LysR family regulator
MDFKWLEDFVSLAATQSFSRSAEERFVTQSAFSRRIKQLESWMGVALVDRATYPARLTRAGAAFLPIARETIRTVSAAREALREDQGLAADTLVFGALHTLSIVFFPGWLHEIRDRIGEIEVELSTDQNGMEAFVHSLAEGETDFFLTYHHPDVPFRLEENRFDHLVLGSDRIVPVSAPDADGLPLHPIGGPAPVRHLAYAPGTFVGGILSRLFATRPLARVSVYRNSMSEGLKAMAVAGWGLAWVPESIARDDLAAGRLVRAGDTDWTIDVEIRLYRNRTNRRPIVDRFWRCLA